MPCALRISSFVPGHRCAPRDTVVPCHIGKVGKGMGTKVSDLAVAAGCLHCHDLLDGRDNRVEWILKHYPAAFWEQVLRGLIETQARWVQMGLICREMEVV